MEIAKPIKIAYTMPITAKNTPATPLSMCRSGQVAASARFKIMTAPAQRAA
ncbi:MAG: hypothetical protein ACKOZU_12190 [Planctomycetaceae bacterium]